MSSSYEKKFENAILHDSVRDLKTLFRTTKEPKLISFKYIVKHSSTKMFKFIVSTMGSGVNNTLSDGLWNSTYPLKIAVQSGKEECVKILLDNGARFKMMINEPDDIIYQAVITGNPNIIEMILQAEKYNFDMYNNGFHTIERIQDPEERKDIMRVFFDRVENFTEDFIENIYYGRDEEDHTTHHEHCGMVCDEAAELLRTEYGIEVRDVEYMDYEQKCSFLYERLDEIAESINELSEKLKETKDGEEYLKTNPFLEIPNENVMEYILKIFEEREKNLQTCIEFMPEGDGYKRAKKNFEKMQ